MADRQPLQKGELQPLHDGDDKLDRADFREVDATSWRDFERLFEMRGSPKSCWCMAWRGSPEERTDKHTRKAAMARRVAEGTPVGLLGYLDGEPVAWVSVAPRSTYRDLGGVDQPDESAEEVWSLVCFFVIRSLRGEGMMRRLLNAAISHARSQGGTVLEAYPVDPDSPSYRFMGFVPSFEAAGFRTVARAGTRRHVMRLDLH